MSSPEQAKRAAISVGAITTLIGGALAAAPEKTAGAVRLGDPTGLRVIGLADLSLVPGLLRGNPRWPWMTARGVLNVAIMGFLLKRPKDADTPKRYAIVAALCGLTVQDLRVAAALRTAGI